MDLTEFLKTCRCYTADQSTADLLPEKQAAVYAFYDGFKLTGSKPVDEIDQFATTRARSIRLDLTTLPGAVTIKLRGTEKRFSGKGKRYVTAVAKTHREEFCNELLFLSIMNEPLYVGETEDVKTRFVAHHDQGFLYRMKRDHQRPPGDFVFFVCLIPNNMHRALETVLIHFMSPSGNTTGSLIDDKS